MLAGIVVFRVFFATLYVCKWKWRYNCNKKYRVKTFNLERTFAKLRAAQVDEGHSSDDEEIYQTAKRIYLEREQEIMGMKGLGEYKYTEKERLEITIDHVHDEGQRRFHQDQDKDDMRNDLDDADEEELEDRIIEEARIKNRPLYLDEVNRLSRKGTELHNLSQYSILSGAVSQQDIQVFHARQSSARADLSSKGFGSIVSQ